MRNKSVNIWNEKKVMSLIFIALAFLIYLVPSIYAAPTIYIFETGNVTSLDNNVTGIINLDNDYEYRAFTAHMNDFYYYNASIPEFSNHVINYTRSFYDFPITEKVDIFKVVDSLTIRYNVTNNLNSTIVIAMDVDFLPSCVYDSFVVDGGLIGGGHNGDNLSLSYWIPPASSRIVNVSCNGVGVATDFFPPAIYDIHTTEILRDYNFRVLPKSFFSTMKERVGKDEGTDGFGVLAQNTTWRAGFEFTNAGNIPVNITQINLWAVPVANKTNDPKENVVFEANYTDCLNSLSTRLDQDEFCIQQGFFDSRYVPIIWSEVFYEIIWNFVFEGLYYFEGNSTLYDFDLYTITLVNPENGSYAGFNEDVDLGFNVSIESHCELYTNMTGTWRREPLQNLNNITEGNFTVTTFDRTEEFVWNVFCTDVSGFTSDFARENFTIYVNALPELLEDIPDLEWPMYTNYTLNLTDYFWDYEGDPITYDFYPNPVVNISFIVDNSTGQIVMVPDHHFYGERTAQIIAVDHVGRRVNSNLFLLNVTHVPLPPEIIFWNITNGTWWTTNETYIEAPADSVLNFTAEATHPQPWFTDPLPGSWFYWFVDGVLQTIGRFFSWYIDFPYVGERNVTLVVNDTYGMYDYQTWIVNVTKIEVPPGVRNIPGFTWKQNTTLTINLTEWFYDPYMLDHNFTFSYAGYFENLTVVLDNDINIINITPDTNWLGVDERWMILTAEDSDNLSTTSNNFTLTVYPWIISPIHNVSFFVNEWDDSINLSQHYNVENYTWSDLQWSAYGHNLEFILNPVTRILNITSNGWTGNQTVLMKVNNSLGWDDYTEFNVEVIPFNHPPEINDTDYYMMQNTTPPYDWIDLWEISYDPDDPYESLVYEIISQSNTTLMTCEIAENRYLNCSAPPEHLWGYTSLNVSVSDKFFTDTARIRIFVEKYIHPPDINDWNITSETFFVEMEDGIYDLEFFENQTLLFQVNTTDREGRPLSHYWTFNDTLISTTENASIYFDFHSSGEYVVHYFVNNTDGGYAELFWNLTVVNLNRPPFPVNLTAPLNNSFLDDFFTFEWTNTTDPDAENPNEDDFWDFVYILQVADNEEFRNPVLDVQFKDTTEYELDTLIPDGRYYWRVIAFDGADAAVSEVWTFLLDLNDPFLTLDIEPKIAEYTLRNVSIEWSAYDVFLEEAYLNISYPNGTHLGTFYDNITLTIFDLTEIGTYEAKVYGRDSFNKTSILTKTFEVLVDTTPPVVTLVEPNDNTIIASNTVIFSYDVDDINHPQSCSLYLQKMNIIYDVVGGIMHKDEAGPWVPVLSTNAAVLGRNYFIYAPLEEDSYGWNVQCTDISGNSGFAEFNRTFRIMLREEETLFPEFPIDDITFEDVMRDGYSLKSRIFPIKSTTGQIVSGTIQLENIGRRTIYDLSFLPSVDWIYFNDGLEFLEPGNKINISFVVRSPVYPGEYMYHIGLVSSQLRQLSSGYIEVVEDAEIPLRVIKRVYEEGDGYRITLTIINNLKHKLNIYIEDLIDGMHDITFSPSDFFTTGTSPPHLSLSRTQIKGNETISVSYFANEIDISLIRKPLVIANVDYVSTLEIISPHYFNVLLFEKTSVEIILIITFIILIILFIIYSIYRNIRGREEFLS